MSLSYSQVREQFLKVALLPSAPLNLLCSQSSRLHELSGSIILEQVVIVWKPLIGHCSNFSSVLFNSSPFLCQSLIQSSGITGFPFRFLLSLSNVVYLGFDFFFIPIIGPILDIHILIQVFA